MKIKIGDLWFDGALEEFPIMVVLSEQDKKNITNMPQEYSKYCVFEKSYWTEEEIKDWMDN